MKHARRALAVALVGGGLLVAAPAQADAAYLPMWTGKQKARTDVRDNFYLMLDDTTDYTVRDCYRRANSTIECTAVLEVDFGDFHCDFQIRVRRVTWANGLLVSYPGESECY